MMGGQDRAAHKCAQERHCSGVHPGMKYGLRNIELTSDLCTDINDQQAQAVGSHCEVGCCDIPESGIRNEAEIFRPGAPNAIGSIQSAKPRNCAAIGSYHALPDWSTFC